MVVMAKTLALLVLGIVLVVDVFLVLGVVQVLRGCAGCGCFAGCLSTTIGAGWWEIINYKSGLPASLRFSLYIILILSLKPPNHDHYQIKQDL